MLLSLSETFDLVFGLLKRKSVLFSLSMKLTPECTAFRFSFAGLGSLGSRMDIGTSSQGQHCCVSVQHHCTSLMGTLVVDPLATLTLRCKKAEIFLN